MSEKDHEITVTGETVETLDGVSTGRWLVTTQGSRHIWDLDAWTYTRIPGVESLAGSMQYDNIAHPITRIERYPTVGDDSIVFYDDPGLPDLVEQWRISSQIESIERLKTRTMPQPPAGE